MFVLALPIVLLALYAEFSKAAVDIQCANGNKKKVADAIADAVKLAASKALLFTL